MEYPVKGAYNQSAKAVSNAGTAVKKWTVKNKESLLTTAKTLQDVGDKTATVGAVMAVAVAGVGAAPCATVAAGGKLTSLVGAGLEIAVARVAGSNKNTAVTAINEVAYEVVGRVVSKAIDQLIPGPTPDVSGQVKEATEQTMGFLE